MEKRSEPLSPEPAKPSTGTSLLKKCDVKIISLIANAALIVAVIIIILAYNGTLASQKSDAEKQVNAEKAKAEEQLNAEKARAELRLNILKDVVDMRELLGDTTALSLINAENYPYQFFLKNVQEGMTIDQVEAKLLQARAFADPPKREGDKISYDFKFFKGNHRVTIIVPLDAEGKVKSGITCVTK